MDQTLKALYNGNIAPFEQFCLANKERASLQRQYLQSFDDLISQIDAPVGAELERLLEKITDAQAAELYAMFLDGFRLGARMAIEIHENK